MIVDAISFENQEEISGNVLALFSQERIERFLKERITLS